MKSEIKSQKQSYKIKYVPCVIGEATNLQVGGRYFNGDEYKVAENSNSNPLILTPDQHLVWKKCIHPEYTEDEVKAMKRDFLNSIVRTILKGSGLYEQSYREQLLEMISTKKKNNTNEAEKS